MIFDDFRGFSLISSFLRVILTASRKQFASKHVHFMDLVWIRAIFGWKSMKFRHWLQNVPLTWSEALRTWKSRFFGKCYLDVLKTWFFWIFVGYRSRISDDFRGFSHISSFLRVILNGSKKQIASKHVHFLSLVWFNPAWRSSETDLVNFRSSIWPGLRQMRFWLNAQIVLAKRTNFGMFGKWGFTFGRR